MFKICCVKPGEQHHTAWRRTSGLLIAVLLLAACAQATALPALRADYARQQQQDGGLTFTLDAPAAPRINQPQRLFITLRDRRGAPVPDAEVYFDLDMDMLCLSHNQPIADHLGDGSYAADTVYVMAGDWRIRVIATIEEVEYRALFTTSVVE